MYEYVRRFDVFVFDPLPVQIGKPGGQATKRPLKQSDIFPGWQACFLFIKDVMKIFPKVVVGDGLEQNSARIFPSGEAPGH